MVECLPSVPKALGLIPHTTKEKEKEKREREKEGGWLILSDNMTLINIREKNMTSWKVFFIFVFCKYV